MNVRQFCKNHDIENTDIRRIKKRSECEDNIINVFPQFRKHVFHGFGNALTASAGQVLLSMPEDSRHAVLENYFSSSCMGFNKLRLCIDSSDFSPYMYCAVSDADDIRNGNLDLSEDERFIFPVLDEIMEIPKRARANCSGALNFRAIWASLGAMSIRHTPLMMPPQKLATVDIPRALADSPRLVNW